MSKIPLKEAIATGAWLDCHAISCYREEFSFRLQLKGFHRASNGEIDRSMINEIFVEGVVWLLSFDVVNLTKGPINGWYVREAIRLVDQDGFEFEPYRIERFASNLNWSDNPGLCRFANVTPNLPLSPKIKASGSITIVLPDEEANYCLAIKDGNIREV